MSSVAFFLFCCVCWSPCRILECTDNVTHPTGPYFAQLGDDCSFCTYGGPGSAPPKRGAHPPVDEAIWCGFKGPCKAKQTTSRAAGRAAAAGALESGTAGFPTDCTLEQWQKLGMDLDSRVADPKIVNPVAGSGWQLAPDSPALALGFQQLNLSAVGPRSPQQRQY
jgi:hypothetical protein